MIGRGNKWKPSNYVSIMKTLIIMILSRDFFHLKARSKFGDSKFWEHFITFDIVGCWRVPSKLWNNAGDKHLHHILIILDKKKRKKAITKPNQTGTFTTSSTSSTTEKKTIKNSNKSNYQTKPPAPPRHHPYQQKKSTTVRKQPPNQTGIWRTSFSSSTTKKRKQ